MRLAAIGVAMLAFAASGALAQDKPAEPQAPPPATNGVAPPAPIGHRQPTLRDLPPDVAKEERPSSGSSSRVNVGPGRSGGPPQLEVRTNCKAAARGAVVLGRDENACLADESAARDTLKQNWGNYSATDKSQCVGMNETGGPESYVELLSCLEVTRDARDLQNADPLEGDDASVSTVRRRRTPVHSRHSSQATAAP
jgi:hypothetical protein